VLITWALVTVKKMFKTFFCEKERYHSLTWASYALRTNQKRRGMVNLQAYL